jgi:hypothetical protein
MPQLTRRARRGAALVELALILPVLLTLVLGVWEIGRLVEVRHCLASAAREAARLAAAGPTSLSEVAQAARDSISSSGLPGELAEVRLTDADGNTVNPYDMPVGQLLHVEVSLLFCHTRYTTLKLVVGDKACVAARSAWCLHSEID